MNALQVAATAFRQLLIAHPTISDRVGNKVFFDLVPPTAALPYVRMTHLQGGNDNITPTKSFDMVWKITVIAQDGVRAEELSAAISDALVDIKPTLLDEWYAYAPITELTMYRDTTTVQNVQYIEMGALYRLRGNKRGS